jgi:YesN/AraC family two-component response regulator
MDDYLSKPIDINQLKNLLAKYVSKPFAGEDQKIPTVA